MCLDSLNRKTSSLPRSLLRACNSISQAMIPLDLRKYTCEPDVAIRIQTYDLMNTRQWLDHYTTIQTQIKRIKKKIKLHLFHKIASPCLPTYISHRKKKHGSLYFFFKLENVSTQHNLNQSLPEYVSTISLKPCHIIHR